MKCRCDLALHSLRLTHVPWHTPGLPLANMGTGDPISPDQRCVGHIANTPNPLFSDVIGTAALQLSLR
jgi:hypothetical protein